MAKFLKASPSVREQGALAAGGHLSFRPREIDTSRVFGSTRTAPASNKTNPNYELQDIRPELPGLTLLIRAAKV
jgi:hypothetical protein